MPIETVESTSTSTSSTMLRDEGSLNMTGTLLAHFANNYSPVYDKLSRHFLWDSEVYLDEELCERLTDDRRRNVQHHLTTDKAFKEHFASRMKNASMMRS